MAQVRGRHFWTWQAIAFLAPTVARNRRRKARSPRRNDALIAHRVRLVLLAAYRRATPATADGGGKVTP